MFIITTLLREGIGGHVTEACIATLALPDTCSFCQNAAKKTLWLAFSSLSVIVLGIFLPFPIILQDLTNPPVEFPHCPRQPFPIPAYYQKISRKCNQETRVGDRILV